MTSESSSNNGYNSVCVPRELMSELRSKCQLMDGAQHDSHELLRQLLDVVLSEDLKRYRRIILEETGSLKARRDEVSEEKRKWIKELDNLVAEQFVMKPDKVFRGTLVSELQCEVCHNISSREEGFLDLSLPVNVEKPQPPAFARRKYNLCQANNLMNGNARQTAGSVSPSADENKMEEMKPKRIVKRVRRNQQQSMDHGEGSITEEDKKENDADVEDNVENGVDDQKEVFESGYSSEKPASSRTSPTAESRQNGDADDSACASPSAPTKYQSGCSQKPDPLSAALATLALNDSAEQVIDSLPEIPTLPTKRPDTLCPSIATAVVPMYAESDDSSDSAGGSMRANPCCSSYDLSTESLQDVGLASQDRSCGSDHDDSQSIENTSANKDSARLESSPVSRLVSDNDQSGDNNDGSVNNYDEASCSMVVNCGRKPNKYDLILPAFDPPESSEEEIEGLKKARTLSYKKGTHDRDESLSNDETQNISSRPSSRLEHINEKARSSPVDAPSNKDDFGNQVLEKSLIKILEKGNYYDTNNQNGEDDRFSNLLSESISVPCDENDKNSFSTPCDGNNKNSFSVPCDENNKNSVEDIEVASNNPPSSTGHLGFVLVGGITSVTDNDESKMAVAASIIELPNSDTVKTPANNASSDIECAEVSPEIYKKNHITLAPRYQCEEGECSVLSCLNHFTAIEMMAGNNKAGCDMCTQRQNKGKEKDAKTVYTNSTKRLLISKPPSVLILHLKRFQVQMRSFRKLGCHVTFPLVLDIAPFCSKSCEKLLDKGQRQILYSLYGVVEHSGTLHGGHYVAYVKVREKEQSPNQPREGVWYYISDSHTTQVTEETVLKTQAYLLFYERIL